jgi:SAM-dependent methyltransferase
VSWEEVSSVYADSVREYHARSGRAPSSPDVERTVRVNTELVPRRGDNLLGLLEELGDIRLEGKRVLEVGCGFGALAAYLAWKARPERLVATDIRPEFLEAAAAAASGIGLDDRLVVKEGDMRDLAALGEDPFDVVIANNAFIYLPTHADMTRALRQFAEALAPGGRILLYHANRWRWTEPFSKDPLVHLLPAPLAKAVCRLTGWRHNHGRVRLVSAPRLMWMLHRAGFADLKVVGFGKERHRSGVRRFFGNFYGVVGRRG